MTMYSLGVTSSIGRVRQTPANNKSFCCVLLDENTPSLETMTKLTLFHVTPSTLAFFTLVKKIIKCSLRRNMVKLLRYEPTERLAPF